MPATTDLEKRVGRYFYAWQTHDTELLRKIFTPGARYIIRGKRTYHGIEEIVGYWERNKRRQEALELHWKVLSSARGGAVAEFGAKFFNPETETKDKVYGQIAFGYGRDGRIVKLSEAYRKETEPMAVAIALDI